jgi:hypothetical protein
MSDFGVDTQRDTVSEAILEALCRREALEIGQKIPDATYFSQAC